MTSRLEKGWVGIEVYRPSKKFDQLFLLCNEAIKISGLKLIKSDYSSGHIEARSDPYAGSIRGFIKIDVEKEEPLVTIQSPDNRAIVEEIFKNLCFLLHEPHEPMFPGYAPPQISTVSPAKQTSSKLSPLYRTLGSFSTPSPVKEASVPIGSYKILREFDIQEKTEIISFEELPLDNRSGSNDLTLQQEFSKTATNEISIESTQEGQGKLSADLFKILQAELSLSLSKIIGCSHGESVTHRYTTTISVKAGDCVIYKITWKRKIRRSKYEILIGSQHYVIPSVARYGIECEITSMKKGRK